MSTTDPLIGSRLGSYQIERLLGRGGMARVYYGVDQQLQRPAAIKVIDERLRENTGFTQRFLREARAMASWRHPNIPQVYQAGMEDGHTFYAMEYIPGENLAQVIRRYRNQGRMIPVDEALRTGEAVAAALDYAHEHGTVHRDVKPQNVLVADDGRILLSDFGLLLESNIQTQGEVFGSPHYLAPEQARSSAAAVPQSDLYALGVMLYQMLVGVTPFDDPAPASLALKHMSEAPPPPRQLNPHLNPAVEAVLLKSLRKQPEERYSSGHELMAALRWAFEQPQEGETLAHTQPLETIPVSVAYPQKSEGATTPMPVGEPGEPQPEEVPPAEAEPVDSAKAETIARQPQAVVEQEAPAWEAAPQPVPAGRPRWQVIGCAGLLGALVLMALCVAAVARLGSSLVVGRPEATAGVIAPARETQPAVLPTEPRQPETTQPGPAAPTAPVSAGVALPTHPAGEAHLALAANKDDSLFLVNTGEGRLILADLALEGGKGHLEGDEWGVEALEPGQCVAVWKEEGKPKAPKDLRCDLVGERLERSGPEKFWTEGFNILYQGEPVGTCEKKMKSCEVSFPQRP